MDQQIAWVARVQPGNDPVSSAIRARRELGNGFSVLGGKFDDLVKPYLVGGADSVEPGNNSRACSPRAERPDAVRVRLRDDEGARRASSRNRCAGPLSPPRACCASSAATARFRGRGTPRDFRAASVCLLANAVAAGTPADHLILDRRNIAPAPGVRKAATIAARPALAQLELRTTYAEESRRAARQAALCAKGTIDRVSITLDPVRKPHVRWWEVWLQFERRCVKGSAHAINAGIDALLLAPLAASTAGCCRVRQQLISGHAT
jgi:hypothetical protein